jgi:Cu-processing system permease protein
MWQHLTVAWRSGLRSRSFHALIILGALAMGAAYLASQFSGRQPGTVALDVGISGIRFVVLLMTVFWCQELIAREVERRSVFLALAYPVPRGHYLIGRFLGIMALVFFALVVLCTMLWLFAWLAGREYMQGTPINLGSGLLATMCYVWLDTAVVAAFTLLVSTFSVTPFLPLALGFAFAVAARSLGQSLAFLRDKNSMAADLAPTYEPALRFFEWLIPDLSRLDIRAAALYNHWPTVSEMFGALAMSGFYIVILLSLATLVFSKRQFN